MRPPSTPTVCVPQLLCFLRPAAPKFQSRFRAAIAAHRAVRGRAGYGDDPYEEGQRMPHVETAPSTSQPARRVWLPMGLWRSRISRYLSLSVHAACVFHEASAARVSAANTLTRRRSRFPTKRTAKPEPSGKRLEDILYTALFTALLTSAALQPLFTRFLRVINALLAS